MTIDFRDPISGKPLRSTEFARAVLAEAARNNSTLQDEILGAPDWRKWYLRLYAQLAIEEGKSLESTQKVATLGLEAFQSRLFGNSGKPLVQEVAAGWSKEDSVTTVVIRGTSAKAPLRVDGESGSLEDLAKSWVKESLAEPGLIDAFKFLDQNQNLPIAKVLLFAVAGAAEFAPTENWLRFGGRVAVVARPGKEKWQGLIAMARSSAGQMLVPIKSSLITKPVDSLSDEEIADLAGLDITNSYAEIASWLSALSKLETNRIILGLYAYAPGIEHIKVQGVQDALAQVAIQNLTREKLALSWLATPTDSAPGRANIAQGAEENYTKRSTFRVIRDTLLGLFGAARKVTPKFFSSESGEPLALIDASVQQQGPSYSFSKRTQRFGAYLAHFAGYKVSYAIAPPARTDSVLRHRILRASYRGAPLFGVKPFEVATAKSAIALVLLRDIHDEAAMSQTGDYLSLHTNSAIHGGLWRLGYRPSSIWIAATAIGILDYFKKR